MKLSRRAWDYGYVYTSDNQFEKWVTGGSPSIPDIFGVPPIGFPPPLFYASVHPFYYLAGNSVET